MQRNLTIFLIVLIVFSLFPLKVLAISDTSSSSIIMDIDSGRILKEHDSNTERLIASTTKIMTFLTALTYASDKLNEEVTVGDEVLKMYGTNMYLNLGEKLKLIDLLYGLMLRSGNDASVVIAKYVGGDIDNFVYLMNEKAKEIGMQNTTYKNPHGLDEETKNYSTAYDLAILTRYLYLNYPLYKEIAGAKYYDFSSNLKSYSLINRSKIIFNYDKITTTKSGFTPSAGKSLVTTASSNNLNLLIVTLDDPDNYLNHERLYKYYFDNYQNYVLLDKNNFKVDGNIFKEKYYIKNNFVYPLTMKEKDSIKEKIIINDKDNSDILGTINILLNDEVIHTENIYKSSSKENKNKENTSLLKKIFNFLKKLFK